MLGIEAVHQVMRTSKYAYLQTMMQLKAKKEEHKDIKKANDEERKRL